MKLQKKTLLQVGVGLAVGVGVLVSGGKQAEASPPCPPAVPVSTPPCEYEGITRCVLDSTETTVAGCYDTDGDCYAESGYAKTVNKYKCVLLTVEPPLLADCTQTIYTYTGPCYEA
jgi:hypothetical protein